MDFQAGSQGSAEFSSRRRCISVAFCGSGNEQHDHAAKDDKSARTLMCRCLQNLVGRRPTGEVLASEDLGFVLQ